MKYIFTIISLISFFGYSVGQNLNKSIDLGSSKMIKISSDYPSIEIKKGESSELVLEGYIYGNGMPLDDVVTVDWNKNDSKLTFITDIESAKSKTDKIETNNLDDLTKEELKEIIKSRKSGNKVKGHNYYDGQYNWNLETHIVIYLPKNVNLVEAEMVYGAFEMMHDANDINVFSTYGSIDVEISGALKKCNLESTYSTVTLRTSNTLPTDYRLQSNYGEIFTNVDLTVDRDASTHKAFKTIIVGSYKNGGDQSIQMRSDYSNVYLRKL